MLTQGIIVAATHHIEWLIPWWWYNYRAHNDLPVVFIDLGMTKKAQDWCKERGTLLPLDVPDSLVFPKEAVDPILASKWEQIIGSGVWDVRLKWFKKPFAFRKSPFEKSLWIDLDCEVRASLRPFFSFLEDESSLALAREPEPLQKGLQSLGFTLPNEITYNSGVVLYRKEDPFLSRWEEEVKQRNHLHIGDQEALSRILFQENFLFKELPIEYNWDRGLGPNPQALIFHWHGQKGKQLIAEQIKALSILGFTNFTL